MDVDQPNTENVIAVLACLESCRAYEAWKQSFATKIERNDALYVYGDFELVQDATASLSFVSLRRIDEFLSDRKKRLSTDLRYYDFKIKKLDILCENNSVLTDRERQLVNIFEAHLTSFGQADVDDLTTLFSALERTIDIRSRLKIELARLLE